MSTSRLKVYSAINVERDYQDQKWNAGTTTTCGIHSNVEFLVFIRDYIEEALHFCSRNGDPLANDFAKNSLRKVAALAVAAMEQNGVIERNND